MTTNDARRTLCLATDIKSWSGRLVPEQIRAQQALVTAVQAACKEAGLPAEILQQTGDGVLVVPPSGIDENKVVPDFIRGLRGALYHENRLLSADAKIRLRLALTAGMVTNGPAGLAGVTIVECFRLLDSAPVRQALVDHEGADLAVIVSAALYQDVVQHGFGDLRAEEFWPVDCSIPDKGFSAQAWVYVTERAAAPSTMPADTAQESVPRDLAEVQDLIARGRPREALKRLDEVADPPNAALELRAQALAALARFEEASVALTRFLEISAPPGPAAALTLRGRCQLELGQVEGARATLEYLLKHHPDHAAGRLELGRLELVEGRTGAARDHLVTGLRLTAAAEHPDQELLRGLTAAIAALPLG